MRLRQSTLSPLLRSLAVFALAGFVAAQALCFVHCHFGGGHGGKTQPSCHGSSQARASHADHDSPTPFTPPATTTCATLKTMLAGADAPTLVTPELHALYFLAPIARFLDTTQPEREAFISRQARPRDWVFTPEVCLGPAFHSLAPPFVG